MKKRIISFLTVLVMVFCMSAVTYAEVPTTGLEKPEFEEPGITPQYDYINSCIASLNISGGTAYCEVDIKGNHVNKTTITITLQKKTLLWWSTEKEWTVTSYTINTNAIKTASVGSGTYRVKAEISVYGGTTTESTTIYSAEKKA